MKIDFNILETGNPKTLVFVDESLYSDLSPIFPTLQVKFPDMEKAYKQLIRTEKVNSIYTTTLGFSSVISDFPDGVYDLKYSIEPHNINYICKKYMKIDQALSKLKDVVCGLTNKDEKYFNKLGEINLLLLSAQLEVNCDSCQANEYLKLANKLISKLSC